jgi:iron complex outermembrane receptor protein
LPAGGQVRLTLFQDDVTDAIFSQRNTATNITNFQNVGKVRTRGVEASATVRRLFLQGLGLTASVGYNHAKILENRNVPASEGKRFPRVPDWRAKAVLDYAPTERWLLSFGGNYASRAFNNLDNSDTRGGYGAVTEYLVFDAKVSCRIARWLTASAGVDNITDYLYFESHPYPRRTFHGELSIQL